MRCYPPFSMATRLLFATLSAALLLSILTDVGLPDCVGQALWTRLDVANQSAVQGNRPPFDKLELFAFFAAGPIKSYAVHVIKERGTNFPPTPPFSLPFLFLS